MHLKYKTALMLPTPERLLELYRGPDTIHLRQVILYHGPGEKTSCTGATLSFRVFLYPFLGKDDTMKIEKLPSGSYRVRKMYNGETYTVLFDYKPTQKEAIQAMSAELENETIRKEQMTFKAAAESYIDLKKNVLSPSTIREYKGTLNRLSDWLLDKRITDIKALDIQKEINQLSKDKSPKTVRNYHGFLTAVLGTFRPNLIINTTLPQKVKNEVYIPSDADIKIILKKVQNTQFEIPILLACYGLRRSEICALTMDDLVENTLTINKAMVFSSDKEWIVKTTKTTESTREVIISPILAEKIRAQGFIYIGHPNSISKHLTNLQDRLGMPHFSIHKLRHYFASKMSELGIPEADILKIGGWNTDHVMKTVYRHSLQTKEAHQRASDKFSDSLFS